MARILGDLLRVLVEASSKFHQLKETELLAASNRKDA
jgi:hypothetical protein